MKYSLVAIMLLCFFAKPCLADESASSTAYAVLTVEVANNTANGTAVENDVVIVQIYKEGQLLQTLDSKVGADGRAVFKNVPAGEQIVAVARARHQNMMFSGQRVALKPAGGKLSAYVRVFDVTDDKSRLSIGTHHFIMRAHSESLEITEYMQLNNSSDMAVSSGEKDSEHRTIVLEIMLPKGFKNLRPSGYLEEGALVVTEEGFYDTMAVAPGDYQVAFSYTLDITSNTMDIVKRFSFPTSSFIVFAELGRAKLQGLGQVENQFVRTNGPPMEYYKRSNLAPAEEITFQITGFNVNTSDLSMWLILLVVFSAVVALAILRLRGEKN